MITKGRNSNRLHVSGNENELIMAETWEQFLESNPNFQEHVMKKYLTEESQEDLATFVQWLGSEVGQGFLKACGFEYVPI
jgi:hypothetical protein